MSPIKNLKFQGRVEMDRIRRNAEVIIISNEKEKIVWKNDQNNLMNTLNEFLDQN
ncbi:MAG: hypothetical protein ACOC44_08150 [Promethearchaeia archaeon]